MTVECSSRKVSRILALLVLVLAVCPVLACGSGYTSPYKTIPYTDGQGKKITITNNENATDQSWAQVQAFLAADITDNGTYIPGYYTCGNFARCLHDNAERKGIRSAFVAIEFETGSAHALNAFDTVDKGLVYVDCTGQLFTIPVPKVFQTESSFEGPETDDKVAYVEEGKKLGFISPRDTAGDFSYSYYEEKHADYLTAYAAFQANLERYNDQVEGYNAFVRLADQCPYSPPIVNHTACLGPADYQTASNKQAELEAMSADLNKQWTQVRGFTWEEMGIVKSVGTYW